MPFVDRECEGPGATHHHACKCREERFKKIESVAKLFVEYNRTKGYPTGLEWEALIRKADRILKENE